MSPTRTVRRTVIQERADHPGEPPRERKPPKGVWVHGASLYSGPLSAAARPFGAAPGQGALSWEPPQATEMERRPAATAAYGVAAFREPLKVAATFVSKRPAPAYFS
ncbi:hypothetical protein MTO96_003681 [Rhipicephalus appendiculatus]